MKYHKLINLFFYTYMKIDDRSWMYRSSDVLAHFKGVCAYLEIVAQHASCQKEETIYCPCKVCKNDVMFKHCEVIHEHLGSKWFYG
jgi:hypothetical protein